MVPRFHAHCGHRTHCGLQAAVLTWFATEASKDANTVKVDINFVPGKSVTGRNR